jgi:hypothetical protein
VLGGATSSLFACVLVAGIKVSQLLRLIVVCALHVPMHSALLLAAEAARSCVRVAFIKSSVTVPVLWKSLKAWF